MQLTRAQVLSLPAKEQAEILGLLDRLEKAEKREAARTSFLAFVKLMWPAFIEGRHHRIMAEAYDRILFGGLKRLIINMPPRHTKSEFSSVYLVAMYLGLYPERKIIQCSHTAELAVGFGRKVRNIVASKEFQDIFPGVKLSKDSKAAGRWMTSKGGEYFAIGVGGNIAGKGADLFVIDDPHSEQDVMMDPAVFDNAYEWYTSGPRQRLQPDAAIVVPMTRWHTRDLTGRLLGMMGKKSGIDQWELIEFPMKMPSGNVLWPEFWSQEAMEALEAELPSSKWNAQYQQNPTSEEGAIIKREWWKIWEREKPPQCKFIISSWDTAFLAKQRNDYSANTVWGVFDLPDERGELRTNIILLDAYKARLEFPDLKRVAYDRWKSQQPDAFIVEGKASGMPLIFELRQMGVPVSDFTPHRGTKANPNDKIARVNGIADIFSSGVVWRPETRWAEEVAHDFAAFPECAHDDLVDAGTMAIYRFRQGGFLSLTSDEEEEFMPRRRAAYY